MTYLVPHGSAGWGGWGFNDSGCDRFATLLLGRNKDRNVLFKLLAFPLHLRVLSTQNELSNVMQLG